MGDGIVITCKKCDESDDFKLGIGMMYFSLINVVEIAVSYGQRSRIYELLEYDGKVKTKYEHRLFECSNCNTLHGRFYVKIFHDGQEVYESNFKCGKCWSKLVPAENEIESYNCRYCSGKVYEKYIYLLWD